MKIEVVAEKMGLPLEHGIPTGSFNGFTYYVSNVSVDTFIKVPMMMFVFERKLTKEDIHAIRKAAGMTQIRFESIVLENNAVLIMFRYGLKSSEKHLNYLGKMTDVFKSLGLKNLNHCPFCGKEDTDSTRNIKGALVKVHNHCATDFYQQVSEHIEIQEQSNVHMGKSLVYALFGAVIGAIPTVITIFGFQYMFALLFALIPLASFYGYKYGGAPRKSWVPIAVSVFSLLIVFGMIYVLYSAIAVAEGLTFDEAMTVSEFSAAFFKDLGTSVLFLAIGVWISWRQMYRQTTAAIKKNFEGLQK